MADRFERLFEFRPNLYTSGSPIVIVAGALLKDTHTNNIIAQLKFLSLSPKKIKAVKLTLDAFDISGNHLGKVEEYQYLDLNISNGEFFGFNKAIVIPNNVARSIKIDKMSIVFDESELTFWGSDLLPLDYQNHLSTALTADLVEQYQLTAKTSGEYIPEMVDSLWLCSCRTLNEKSTCANCGAKKDTIFSAFNPTLLNEHLQDRIEQQKQIEEHERRKLEEIFAKKKQNHSKYLKLGLVAVLVLIVVMAINAISNHISDKRTVEEIYSCVENGQYEQAFDIIQTSDLSFDDKEQYRNEIIPYMQEQHEERRESSSSLVVVLDETEYYVSKDEIYSKTDGEKTVLYEPLGFSDFSGGYSNTYLRNKTSIYANGYLFFVEIEKSMIGYTKNSHFTAKCIDLATGDVQRLSGSDSFGGIVKLANGSIFISSGIFDPYDGVVYNPYTGKMYSGEDIVYEGELETKIYAIY